MNESFSSCNRLEFTGNITNILCMPKSGLMFFQLFFVFWVAKQTLENFFIPQNIFRKTSHFPKKMFSIETN